MKEYYFKPTTNSGVNAFFDSSVKSCGLEDKKAIEKIKRSECCHHNSRIENNLIGTDLYINDQINKYIDRSSLVTDSKLIHKRDKLEKDHLKNDELRDRGKDRKHKVKDRSKDKNKIKGRNKDRKYESKDRSKHRDDELKDKYELKRKEHKYDLKDDCIDHNSKLKREYRDHKCMLKDNHNKSKSSTKDNVSKIRKDSSRSERSESKYRGSEIVSATDDHQEKERKLKRKSSERRKNYKKLIIVEEPEKYSEEKGAIINSDKEKKRNRNNEKISKSRSSKSVKKIDETSSRRKKPALNDNSKEIHTHMHNVKDPKESSKKRISKSTDPTGESVLTELSYRRNLKFKSGPLSTSNNYTDGDIDVGEGIKTKNFKFVKDKMDVENYNKRDLMNYGNNQCKENFVKESFNKVTVQDIYKMENMMEYEMDMKKRFLKKMESNRKRTQISMIGKSPLFNYYKGHNERKEISPPEELPINGTIETSNLPDFITKCKRIRQKRKKHRSMRRDRKTIYGNGVSSALPRPSTKMSMSSNLDKTCEKNIFDGECSKKSLLQVEEKNKNNSLYDTGIINTNTCKTFNREKKRVSFATKCGLISKNSGDDSCEKLAPLKNLKKIISNNKINKVGLNKKRNMFNKKTWHYSSKLLKLFRNKSISFGGKERNLYQSIKKKPRIGEKLDTRFKSNNLPWYFKNKINLYNYLLKESSKSIEDEVCKKELELKESNPAITEQRSVPITLDNDDKRMNDMTLRSCNINSNQLLQNNKLKISSSSSINKKDINEETSILPQNENQVNCDCRTVFHFPHKDNNLKFINDTIIGPNDRNNMFQKSDLGNNENLSYLKFHNQDHNNHSLFPDWHKEVKAGSECGNIKMEFPEKGTNNYSLNSKSFLKPEGPFFKKMDRSNDTNNYFRRNTDACSNYGKIDYELNLTNNAKNNHLLRQKRLWNNKSFGKIVNGSAYYPILSRRKGPPDFKSCLNNDCSDQMLSYESRKEVGNSVKTLNGILSEYKLNNFNNDGVENSNSAKVIIKDSHKSMLEIKFSDKFSINVNGNEIKVEKFGINDVLKGQLTIVNNNFKKDNEAKTCSDTKLYTSVEKGITTENQINSDRKFNHNTKIIKKYKTFADKSSWTENDCVPHKVWGNNSDRLAVDEDGNKTEVCSGVESSTICMVDVGTDCMPCNTIPTTMDYIESDGAKHSDREPNYGLSNHTKNLEANNTPPNRNATFIEYNNPENGFENESKNLLKTMEIINNNAELNIFKQDVGTQYDVMGITCLENQIQKSTSIKEKSNILYEREKIKYNKPPFRIVDENSSTTINSRGNINNNIDESLGIIKTEMTTDIFDLGTIKIGLPHEEICKQVVLSDERKYVDLSAPNIPEKCKNSMKNEDPDRNMFTYLVKKIKTLINIVSGKFKLEVSSKLDQQSKSKKTLSNPKKIKSCISFTKKQKYRVNSECLNWNNCKENTNLDKKMQNFKNTLIEQGNFEENNSVEEELQLDPIPNFKGFIIEAVEKFLISNLEFLPTNVEPFQISINNDQQNFDNSNQLQNLNNFKNKTIHVNPSAFTSKCRNNICLVSNKRTQHKNNFTFSPSTTMIKRFFGKDKRKKFATDDETSQFLRVPPEEVETGK